jgi:ABC-type sugar transport system ATPase subunit
MEGEEVDIREPRDSARLGISVIHQALSVIPSLTIGENFMIKRGRGGGRWLARPDRRRAAAQAREGLAGSTSSCSPIAWSGI